MAKQLGRKMLLKYQSAAQGATKVYTTIAALTNVSVSCSSSPIDVTTGDGQIWQEVLTGKQMITISGDGTFTDAAHENKLHETSMSATPVMELQLLIPDYATLTGDFFIESFDYSGGLEDAVTFSISLTSTGTITRATV